MQPKTALLRVVHHYFRNPLRGSVEKLRQEKERRDQNMTNSEESRDRKMTFRGKLSLIYGKFRGVYSNIT